MTAVFTILSACLFAVAAFCFVVFVGASYVGQDRMAEEAGAVFVIALCMGLAIWIWGTP